MKIIDPDNMGLSFAKIFAVELVLMTIIVVLILVL